MKKLLTLLATILLSAAGFAQLSDKEIEGMMVKRTMTQADVAYNIADLAPRWYREGKTDTLKQLLNYYGRNYGAGTTMIPLAFMVAIQERTFKEELANKASSLPGADTSYYSANILYFLTQFTQICSDMTYLGGYEQNLRAVYVPYLSFLGLTAGKLRATPGLMPAERFLLQFFEHPSNKLFDELEKPEYNGTRIQRAWLEYSANERKIRGVTFGFTVGTWVPTGKLSLVGVHPVAGWIFGGRGDKFGIDVNLSLRFVHSANYYNVVVDQKVYNTNYYLGGYIGLDGMYELMRKRKNAFELLGGVAWDGFDALPGDSKDKDAINKSIGGLNLNIGLGYRKYIRQGRYIGSKWHTPNTEFHLRYLAVQAKFHWLNYNNDGGTPMTGNAFTLGLIYGGCTRPVRK